MRLQDGGAAIPPNGGSKQLMEAVVAGDSEAVNRLVCRYRDRVFHFLCRWIGDREEAADVTQEVLLRVWSKADQYDDRYPLASWVYRIASNLCTDHFRRKNARVHANSVSLEERHPAPRSYGCSPEQLALQREMVGKVGRALAGLPPRQRQVLQLRLLHQYRLREIAEAQGISVGTVKSTLHSGLHRVRESLAE